VRVRDEREPRIAEHDGAAPGLTPRRSRARAWITLVVVVAVVAGGAWVALSRPRPAARRAPAGQAARAAPPVPVVTAASRRGDLPVYLTALGSVTPLQTVTVRSRVDGQLLRTHFTEGQLVHAGDVIAEIDPRPFEAQLAQAEGQLARDRAGLANARTDLARYQRLVRQEMIARQQYDAQVMSVQQLEAAIRADEGAIQGIRLNLTYARITAPITGRVGLRLVDPGNIVHASDAGGLVVITQVEPIAVVFTVPEDSLPPLVRQYRAGAAVPVDAFDREMKSRLAGGTLTAIDNQIDPATGTVKLKATFANHDGALFPNQFVNARVLVTVLRETVLAPAEAVQRGPQGAFVYVVKPDKTVDLRRIDVGPTEGGVVAVRTGLEPGETLVVDGAEKVQPGARVEPTARARSGGERGAAEPGAPRAGGA